MSLKYWVAGVVAALVVGNVAFAEEIEGVVRVVGSAINAKTIITPGQEFKGPNLCRDDEGKKISRLTGLTVKVTGDWQLTKEGEKKCFDASSYNVTKTSSGRDAVVGVLSKKGGGYVVKDDSGTEHALTEVPDGLKKLEGKKIIVDLKPMDNPALKDAAAKVVTYSEFP